MEKNKLIVPDAEIFVPGTPKPEADYLELERLGAKLGIPVPMVHVKVEATNPDGSPGERYEGRSRTFNRNFWNRLLALLSGFGTSGTTFGAGYLTNKNTSGASANHSYSGYIYWINNTGNYGRGIGVGTGTAAEDFEGYNLSAPISGGSGAGQLVYNTQDPTTESYNSGTKKWSMTLKMILNNNSGGTIVVAETAIVDGSLPALICRDLLGSAVSVLNAGQLTVTYTITLTFPA